MKKNSTAMERLLKEGFFETKEAALPYLMSGAVYCGAVQVTTGGQKVPLDKPITVRGLDDRYVSKGGYKLEGAIADFGINVNVFSIPSALISTFFYKFLERFFCCFFVVDRLQ